MKSKKSVNSSFLLVYVLLLVLSVTTAACLNVDARNKEPREPDMPQLQSSINVEDDVEKFHKAMETFALM